ncbi:MAG TPA: DUF3455 domain-containing protein [Blastocatellia bacterium]|nr:DUF3455 domain-containing protein [Blastocatellia bacterium]
MYRKRLKRAIGLVVLITIAGLLPTSIPAARAADNNHEPDLPSPLCDRLQVPPGNKVAFHVYALGVQIYRWNGTSWVLVAPLAMLFADANYSGKVGIHYAGPTWESNSGSKVVATRLEVCSPEPTAIPWLKLQTVSTEGPGIFSSVTYIQRVNTTGGLAPTAPASAIDAVVEVPYTAEYYFYRAED